MADNKAVFEIIISDKGVKITQKGIDNLGDSVKRTGKAARAAAGDLEKVNDVVNTGVSGANNGTRSFARLRDSIDGSNGIVAAYATLATNAFAVSAAFNMLREARGVEMTMQGLSVTSERVGIELTTVASAMKDVTGQAIDMADAMKYTAQLTAAGLDTSQIDRLTKAATTAAYALGREVPDAIQRLTLAVAKNEPELVDELGMTIKSKEAWDDYGRAVGKSGDALTDQQKKIALLNAWTKQTTESFGDLSSAMDPNEYNQLGAAFSELIRNTISSTSSFLHLGDAVKYLSENSTALYASIVIFLSGISKQLIPGLYNLEAASERERKALEASIRVQRQKIQTTNLLAQAQAKASMVSVVKDLDIDKKDPAKYKEYVAAEKAGLATAAQRDAVIKTLTRSEAQYKRFSDGTVAATLEQKAAADILISTRQKQIAQIREIQAIEAGAAAQTIATENTIAGMRRKNVASRLQGLALEKQAYAIEQAGTGSIKEALTGGLGAIETYKRSLSNAAEGAAKMANGAVEGSGKIGLFTKSLNAAKLGVFSLSTGLKVLASGLLRLIPYVGWAMLAWDLLGDTVKKILGGYFDTSKVEKAAEELSTVANNAGKVFERAAKDQANIAISAAQVVKNVQAEQKAIEQAAGAVAKYREELRKAREAEKNPNIANMTARQRQVHDVYQQQEEARKKGDIAARDRLDEQLKRMGAIDSLNEEFKLGISDNSKVLQYYGKAWDAVLGAQEASLTLEERQAFIKTALNKEQAAEIRLMEEAFKNPEVYKYFQQNIESIKEFEALNHDKRIEAVEKALNQAAASHRNMADSVGALNSSYEQLKKTTDDYFTSIKPSTAYDAMVEGLGQVTSSIMEAKAAMVDSSYSDKAVTEFENAVLAAGQKNNALLSAQTNNRIKELDSLRTQYDKVGNDQEKRNALEAKMIPLRKEITDSIQKELSSREELFKAAQADAILGQSLVGIAQARLQVLQRQGIVTAEDYKKQIAAENNIKQVQISSLEIQKKLLAIKLDLAKEDLNKAKEELESAVRQEEEIERKQRLLALTRLEAAIKSNNLEDQRKAQEEIQRLDDPATRTADTLRRQAAVKRLEDAMRSYGLGMQAINNQQRAIQITMIDSRTAELESQKLSIQLQKRLGDLEQEGIKLTKDKKQIQDEITEVLKGQINYYNKLEKIESDTTSQITASLSNYADQIATNQIQLELAQNNRNQSQVRYYTLIGSQLRENFKADMERIRAQDELNRIQLLGVNINQDGLEIQQKALEGLQKALDQQQSLIDQRKQLRQLDAQIQAKRLGTEVSPEQQRKLDILAAKESLQIFRQQLGIKVEGIKLEYALLEAQRLSSILELKQKRELLAIELAKADRLDKNSIMMLQQMDAAIAGLSSMSYGSIRDNAIKLAQGELAVKEKELQLLQTNARPLGEGLLTDMLRAVSAFEQIRKTDTEIKVVDASNTDAFITGISTAIADPATQFAKAAEDLNVAYTDYIPKQIIALEGLTKALESEASRLRSSRLSASTPTVTGPGSMVVEKPSDIKMRAGAWEKPVREEMVAFVRFLQQRIPEAVATSFAAGRHEKGSSHAPGLKADITGAVATSAIKQVADDFRRLTGIIIGVNDEHQKPQGAKAWSGPHTDLKFIGRILDRPQEKSSIRAPYSTPGIGDDINKTGPDFLGGLDAPATALENAGSNLNTGADALNTASIKLTEAADKVILVLGAQGTQKPKVDVKGLADSVISGFANNRSTQRDSNGRIVALGGTTLKESVSAKINDIDSQMSTAVSSLRDSLTSELFPDGELLTGPKFETAMKTFKTRFAEGFAAIKTTANEQLSEALPLTALSAKVSEFWEKGSTLFDPMLAGFKKLGPDGELFIAAFNGIKTMSTAITDFASEVELGGLSLENMATLASTALNVVQSVTQAATNAKIAAIDKEIAAEQKRDGKSAQSVAKLDALEKKKDAAAKKQFNINKKMSMAQAVIATATGIAEALKWGVPFGPIAAGIIGAMGAAQIAMIANTQYESSYTPKAASMPSTLTIGKRGDTVNLARGPNVNAGGEIGYLRGASGTGTSATDYRTIGSAYGGDLMRGYGNRGFVVGEKGPEIINPETPINVTPANDIGEAKSINASINIQALDASDVKKILVDQRGNIIEMLREAANNSGQSFLEGVNTNAYTRPNVGKL